MADLLHWIVFPLLLPSPSSPYQPKSFMSSPPHPFIPQFIPLSPSSLSEEKMGGVLSSAFSEAPPHHCSPHCHCSDHCLSHNDHHPPVSNSIYPHSGQLLWQPCQRDEDLSAKGVMETMYIWEFKCDTCLNPMSWNVMKHSFNILFSTSNITVNQWVDCSSRNGYWYFLMHKRFCNSWIVEVL